MQPLYTEAEFKAAKSRQLLPLRCLHCTKTFHKTKHDIQGILNPRTVKTGDFCSHACFYNSTYVLVECLQCHKSFKKCPSQIRKTTHHFCCRSCGGKYNSAHRTNGTRCSKLEQWLQIQLPALYPNIEFHFNRTDAINAELDVFIPSLKLAFELNGIFHYEPIFGPDKLASIQTNDNRKMLACAEKGIELCVLDTTSQRYFKERTASKFLNIIRSIIDLKINR